MTAEPYRLPLQDPADFSATAPKAPTGLYVAQDPYPHLRDDDGCVLARDCMSPAKLAFILEAVREKIARDA